MKATVTLRVPGTSANIGPGFDSLGIALSVYNTFSFSFAQKTYVTDRGNSFEDPENLALIAFRKTCDFAGVKMPHVHITIDGDVPVSRGLGSSSTLLVAGAVGANELLGLGIRKQDLLDIVNALEGHPDNVSPALYGGLTASMQKDGHAFALPLSIHPSLHFCAFIPNFKTSTHEARQILPKTVSYADAVFNASHVAVLLPALAEGNVEAVRLALDDKLHQPYRYALIDEHEDVERAAKAAGAVAFYISGSGSTLMAIYQQPDFPAKMRTALSCLTHEWKVLPLTVDTDGAKILS